MTEAVLEKEEVAGVSAAPAPATPGAEVFDFEGEFQTKVAALALRDNEFMRRTAHVLKPEFFANIGEAGVVNISIGHYEKYGCIPDSAAVVQTIRDRMHLKILKQDAAREVAAAFKALSVADISGAKFVEEKVVAFARHQAMASAILASVDKLNSGKYGDIETVIKAALEIGVNEDGDAYDYYSRIEERHMDRMEKLSGLRPPQGITTGNPKLDELLYHRGWGRRELTSIMGGAKAGKTTALINFAKNASVAGHNVLYCTLEVGANIISDRLDASTASVLMKELADKSHSVKEKIEELAGKAGKLILHEYPSGTMTPAMLEALIERYKSAGRNKDGTMRPPIIFDLVVVDYADIMKPNFRTSDTIENSKSVYVDLRAVAFKYNCAVLTATQTNREGFKSVVAKAEHVSEDFNKVRTVDLMLSINKTEEEAARGEARLYFAASRNQESGFTVVIKQNLAMMQFIQAVLRVE